MNTAAVITDFLKWVLIEGVSHGFLHFIAWAWLLSLLCGIPRLVSVAISKTVKTDD